MSEIFAKMISKNSEELSILRGVIAETEGATLDSVEIVIEPLDTRASSFSDELDSLLK